MKATRVFFIAAAGVVALQAAPGQGVRLRGWQQGQYSTENEQAFVQNSLQFGQVYEEVPVEVGADGSLSISLVAQAAHPGSESSAESYSLPPVEETVTDYAGEHVIEEEGAAGGEQAGNEAGEFQVDETQY
ncbi:hypothetical protein BESB_020550 [Besnoitia besnoiti]|uniref:Uncharacterized protein n=1 Tax=Besnoitia besnoiti TaxID=94643 RepID=A0A2A9M4G6_BESBE|nr:hypothetical protein BESB_020550 [Besnoitia besnoiti]PFH32114.1 hypothetical protein BESB_020550 [Besnoitia besnoiti]